MMVHEIYSEEENETVVGLLAPWAPKRMIIGLLAISKCVDECTDWNLIPVRDRSLRKLSSWLNSPLKS
jgi:hypothetical protein